MNFKLLKRRSYLHSSEYISVSKMQYEQGEPAQSEPRLKWNRNLQSSFNYLELPCQSGKMILKKQFRAIWWIFWAHKCKSALGPDQ